MDKQLDPMDQPQVEGVKSDLGKLPYFTVLFKQFPLALKKVIECSQAGHNKYHATDKDWQNFSRVPHAKERYRDAALRHMTETGLVKDMLPYGEMSHEAATIWNLLASLEIEERGKKEKEDMLKAEEGLRKASEKLKAKERSRSVPVPMPDANESLRDVFELKPTPSTDENLVFLIDGNRFISKDGYYFKK